MEREGSLQERGGASALTFPVCTLPAAPLHVFCSDDRIHWLRFGKRRAGSRAALPTLPGGEISSIMMTTLTQQAVKAVPIPQIVLPSAPRASQAPQAKPRHQQRVPKDRRRQLATEEPMPVYTLAPAGPPSSQTHPFTSQLLSSAQIEREGVSWLLLQGWEGYDSLMHFGRALQTGIMHFITCSRCLCAHAHHLCACMCLPFSVSLHAFAPMASSFLSFVLLFWQPSVAGPSPW